MQKKLNLQQYAKMLTPSQGEHFSYNFYKFMINIIKSESDIDRINVKARMMQKSNKIDFIP
jgi:hypothetical protein